MKIIFCLLVNTSKPKFVAFLVFVCTSASFSAQISSSQNALKRDDILAPVAKQLMAKDIFRVTGANQNVRKLLFADLVNTYFFLYFSLTTTTVYSLTKDKSFKVLYARKELYIKLINRREK